jgi:hypothetical protein
MIGTYLSQCVSDVFFLLPNEQILAILWQEKVTFDEMMMSALY